MKPALAIVFTILIQLMSHGQMLQNTEVNVFDGRPEFSSAFMRSQNIKTISGTFVTKASMDVIRETKEFTYLKFNRFGELTFEYKTLLGDTLFILYVWDERSNLIVKRSADRYGYSSYHYRYDDKNRLIYSELRTAKYQGEDRLTHVPDLDKKVSYENFEYIDLDSKSYKKFYLNNSGIVYKEEFFYFDDSGRLLEQTAYQKSGPGKSSHFFKYDDAGKLIEKKYENSIAANFSDRYEYEYDASGNIFAMKYYENEIYKTEFQYVYDSESPLLTAIIMRDVASQVMTIIKYDSYTYY
ncbi:MAG: hypothetical protein IPH24_05845 [Crocinitomicaceae bacterium]|nr:hypothetical protein [Crocinitomicaceae bacterium]